MDQDIIIIIINIITEIKSNISRRFFIKNKMNNPLLVTGVAGFIGFHLSKSLLEDGHCVCGIDNLNNYYSIELKKKRLNILKKFSKFFFKQTDISNSDDLLEVFNLYQPYQVVHLAAQAGVRYSIENPYVYSSSNLVGFTNIIELCKNFSVKGLIYASSSSVYGLSNNSTFKESDIAKPISFYGATKLSNEITAYTYSKLFGLNTTGLRFFTVYGPWGRPDMAYYKFAEKIFSGDSIDVYNRGDMYRDFTYIDDIVNGIKLSIKKNYHYEIFNLGNNKSEKLLNVIHLIEEKLGKKIGRASCRERV